MRLIKPSYEILHIDEFPLQKIELAGRTCYKSEDRISEDSANSFCRHLITRGHFPVIEHASMSVKFIIDRGVSHELVRHRLCAFCQESTRYCNYKGGVTFVIPPWCENIYPGESDSLLYPHLGNRITSAESTWHNYMLRSEIAYKKLLTDLWTPQQARSVLPNSLKTEIVVTANLREWRHIFQMRTPKAAHPQMREIMVPLLEEVNEAIPVLFEDIYNDL